MCVSSGEADTYIHSALEVSQQHISEKVLDRCFSVEYPRENSIDITADNGRFSDGAEVPAGSDEIPQSDRMKKIDQFFRNRGSSGEPEITYADREALEKLAPDIADELHISREVASRSLAEYGKSRGWL